VTVQGLDHVSVTCADLDRSLAFYHGLLGIPIRDRGRIEGGSAAAILGVDAVSAAYADMDLGDGRTLELLAYTQPAGEPLDVAVHRPGAGHVALRVAGIDAICARLRAGGHPTASPAPVTVTEPGFWEGARVAYASDPDGAVVELIERPAPGRLAAGSEP
jgi:catechol 2,3-dioxygenase-like lactoylglutathione lyase family enzyme